MARRWLLTAVVGILIALFPATPAAAHDVGGVGATNFRTTLSGVSPAIAGLTLRVIENGSRLELRNDTSTEVVVQGYRGEPYARVGPAGVFLNDNSPATYLNNDRFSITTVPASVDPTKPPQWRQIGTEPVLRWHDHRTHWMLTTLPPQVAGTPGDFHHISSWTVALTYGQQELTATGSLDWVPGPSPWPWFLLLAALIVGLAATAWLKRPHWILAGAAVALVAGQLIHGIGISQAIVGTVPQKLGAILGYDAVLIWPIALFAAWLLARGHARAIWLAGGAGLFVAITLIVDDAPLWWRSSAPSGLPSTLNRLFLTLAVGTGLGLVAAAVPVVRRHAPPARPWEPPPTEESTVDVDEPPNPKPASVRGKPKDVREKPKAPEPVPAGLSRRQLGGYLAAGAVGAVAGGAIGAAASSGQPTTATPNPTVGQPLLADVGTRAIDFRGAHQAGIASPPRPQAHGWVAGFDLIPGATAVDLADVLSGWTRVIAALTVGEPTGDSDDAVVAGLGPSGLTVTIGFGPTLFGKAGIPATARPLALEPLPAFPGETLDPARSDGDLGLIVAADDPMMVAHAARQLTRRANGIATTRWQLTGFNAARGAGSEALTGRNLMGQIDGTNNPKLADPDFAARIFVPSSDPTPWLRGASYVVIRRIRMLLDDWDKLGRPKQEEVIGRRRDNGAPLTGGTEFTPADYGKLTAAGEPIIPADAHIRLAAPAFNDGAAILRRGFSFVDGPSSGLLFVAWQADPRRGFIPVQRKLVAKDAMRPFIQHETSALFVAPGGAGPDEYIGQRLLEP